MPLGVNLDTHTYTMIKVFISSSEQIFQTTLAIIIRIGNASRYKNNEHS